MLRFVIRAVETEQSERALIAFTLSCSDHNASRVFVSIEEVMRSRLFLRLFVRLSSITQQGVDGLR